MKLQCTNRLVTSYLVNYQGLKVGDLVLKFGSLNLGNFQDMKSVATVVEHSKGVRIKL